MTAPLTWAPLTLAPLPGTAPSQANMTTAASPGTTIWVYRNSIKALPWYTSVRKTLTDPACARGGAGARVRRRLQWLTAAR